MKLNEDGFILNVIKNRLYKEENDKEFLEAVNIDRPNLANCDKQLKLLSLYNRVVSIFVKKFLIENKCFDSVIKYINDFNRFSTFKNYDEIATIMSKRGYKIENIIGRGFMWSSTKEGINFFGRKDLELNEFVRKLKLSIIY